MLENVTLAIRQELAAQRKNTVNRIIALHHPERIGETLCYKAEPDRDLPSMLEGASIKARWQDAAYEIELLQIGDSEILFSVEKALPADCKKLTIKYDPTFILEKLRDLLLEAEADGLGDLTQSVYRQDVLGLGAQFPQNQSFSLNPCQDAAVNRMLGSRFHLLWGPPGTGKTTTLGRFVEEQIKRGKTCLLLAISNAAVDELTKSVVDSLAKHQSKTVRDLYGKVLRYGATRDPSLQKLVEKKSSESISERLEKYEKRIKHLAVTLKKNFAPSEAMRIHQSIKSHRKIIDDLKKHQDQEAVSLLSTTPCVAMTLARYVTDSKARERLFDTVVVDECSMVPLPFTLAASLISKHQLILGGDPCQLPPIVVSDTDLVAKYYAPNIFQYLKVLKPDYSNPCLSYLDRQYRMTSAIRQLVSELMYNGTLKDGVSDQEEGDPPLFIEVPPDYAKTWYSVKEGTYYNPIILPILHILLEEEEIPTGERVLLLNPFRAQHYLIRSILESDRWMSRNRQSQSSTIHKAQGGQAHTVIVDLTTHDPKQLPQFFKDATCNQLLNVAMSRTQRRLILIGSIPFIRKIAENQSYFLKLLDLVRTGSFAMWNLEEMLCSYTRVHRPDWFKSLSDYRSSVKCRLVEWEDQKFTDEELKPLLRIPGERKLLVCKKKNGLSLKGITLREENRHPVPSFVSVEDRTLLRCQKNYYCFEGYNANDSLDRLALGHLFEDSISIERMQNLLCDFCANTLVLEVSNDDYRLRCDCGANRPARTKDLTLLASMQQLICPTCHSSMVARESIYGLFLGCSNNPICKGKRQISEMVF